MGHNEAMKLMDNNLRDFFKLRPVNGLTECWQIRSPLGWHLVGIQNVQGFN